MVMIWRLSVPHHKGKREILIKNKRCSVQIFMKNPVHFEIIILLIDTSLDHLMPFPSVHLEDALESSLIFRRCRRNEV